MVKTGDDWQISPPLENEQPDINAIVTAWQTAEALSVREYEMEADTETVTVQMKDHPPVTFNIAVTDSGMILGRQDLQLQYHLSRYDYQQMFINTTPGMAASPVE